MEIYFKNLKEKQISQNVLNKVQSFLKKVIEKQVQKDQKLQKRQKNHNRKINKKQVCSVQDKGLDVLNPKQTIQICSGLFLSDDGVIRFCYSVSQFCFGYSQDITQFIQLNKNLGIVEIVGSMPSKTQFHSVEEALKHVFQIPSQYIHNIAEKMVKFKSYNETMKEYLKDITLTQEILDEKDSQFTIFKNRCMDALQEIQNKQPYLMYQYAIGRYNYSNQDYEFIHRGFSLSYLQLLGIDVNNFSQIFLRGQRVDLTESVNDIFDLSYQGLNSIINQTQNDSYECRIKTFDGFPIKIIQHKRTIQIPNFSTQQVPCLDNFTFGFTEFDVDFSDLQKLIEYRSNILQNKKKLNLDDYINKELSYLFEDVEYSILSQQFLENFYKENLVQMMNAQQFIKEKQCSYRYIKH
ncbi:hypothetical protein TTHERM_00622770 (macronuclear) [Tetrahymena thermophila SB210]|uniref:Uncharacterized protein n=1 Tax=Tetrahymena thermophila (strain SB210) TaxID=312017 RepID=Q241A7_TETTS|nr:hypothetical protein TTHERM_00622770 [Tetrahymena thermophila SB210]EAS02257.2 hypothetical protein TTHERM_00622770 [Tetrahymena thermophila SB210]|eukprot:XP_001022502.2 hypothetical protein TTHERM_00622770 [Tetrahymena thermophila SB210]